MGGHSPTRQQVDINFLTHAVHPDKATSFLATIPKPLPGPLVSLTQSATSLFRAMILLCSYNFTHFIVPCSPAQHVTCRFSSCRISSCLTHIQARNTEALFTCLAQHTTKKKKKKKNHPFYVVIGTLGIWPQSGHTSTISPITSVHRASYDSPT